MVETFKETVGKIYTVSAVILKRLLPVATFLILFVIIASLIDRKITMDRPATDYLRYYSFNVQNAREGEDVNFQVCRAHDQNYSYSGDLSIYVIPNATKPNEDAKVFAKDIGGTLRPGTCENKILLASEFKHTPGKYKMFVSVSFREPRYNIEKTTSFSSNIYTIYAQPTELNASIEYLQQQLEQAQRQLQDANSNSTSATDDFEAPGTATTPATTQPNSQTVIVQPAQPTTSTEPKTKEVCTVNLLGIKVGCRQEPV